MKVNVDFSTQISLEVDDKFKILDVSPDEDEPDVPDEFYTELREILEDDVKEKLGKAFNFSYFYINGVEADESGEIMMEW